MQIFPYNGGPHDGMIEYVHITVGLWTIRLQYGQLNKSLSDLRLPHMLVLPIQIGLEGDPACHPGFLHRLSLPKLKWEYAFLYPRPNGWEAIPADHGSLPAEGALAQPPAPEFPQPRYLKPRIFQDIFNSNPLNKAMAMGSLANSYQECAELLAAAEVAQEIAFTDRKMTATSIDRDCALFDSIKANTIAHLRQTLLNIEHDIELLLSLRTGG